MSCTLVNDFFILKYTSCLHPEDFSPAHCLTSIQTSLRLVALAVMSLYRQLGANCDTYSSICCKWLTDVVSVSGKPLLKAFLFPHVAVVRGSQFSYFFILAVRLPIHLFAVASEILFKGPSRFSSIRKGFN